MKGCLILLLSLASTLTYSADANKQYVLGEPVNSETGLSFSIKSSEDAVCKDLGFRKALNNSATQSDFEGNLGSYLQEIVELDSEGPVSVSIDPPINQITCIGKLNQRVPKLKNWYVISNPLDLATELPFSLDSSGESVCKKLGYTKLLPGSNRTYRHSYGIVGALMTNTREIKEDGTEKTVRKLPLIKIICAK